MFFAIHPATSCAMKNPSPLFLFEQPTGAQPSTATASVPKRDAMQAGDTWDLSKLYASDKQWEAGLRDYEITYPSIASFKGTLGESPEKLLACLEFQKSFQMLGEKLGHYAGLRMSEDGSHPDHLDRQARLASINTQAAEVSAYFVPELQAIPDETFALWLELPALTSWKSYLKKIRRFKPHSLGEKEERLLALFDESLSGHHETFSQLTNVDMRFGELPDENGQMKALSQSSFSSFLQSRDAGVRKNAFHQFYREFSEHQFSLASLLANSVKSDVAQGRARGYASALDAALFQNEIPREVYTGLISAVRGRLEPLLRYYDLRRNKLGLTEIHHYDTYVPIVPPARAKHTFDEALQMVLESLEPLGSDYVGTLEEGIGRSRWCDRYETKGKRSGAFSSGSYGNPPYILMNYKDDVFSDIYTLAHEAGHSMHTWFSQKHQSFQDSHYSIFVAEVASTFNEELLTHHLLEKTDDPMVRAYIINRQIDDIRGTLYRQTLFAEFEKIIHEKQESGEALTLASFRKVYRALLEDYFGPHFSIDDELEWECLRIPHFYSAFYVYQYATGISAALSLSQKVLENGRDARDRYLDFLKTGGSIPPLEALKIAGVDMSKPEPVKEALDLFAKRIEELEKLLS